MLLPSSFSAVCWSSGACGLKIGVMVAFPVTGDLPAVPATSGVRGGTGA